MVEILERYPAHVPYRFSLCDCIIDQIIVEPDAVTFMLPEGFFLVGVEGMERSGPGQVRLLGSGASDIRCWIVRRQASRRGARLFGEPVSLEELSSLLKEEKKTIELYSEMYEDYGLLWRGALFPCDDRLSTHIAIESIDPLKIEFGWDIGAK